MGDIGFQINGKTLENLELYTGRSSKLGEMRLLELADIAVSLAELSVELLAGGIPLYELLSMLSEELALGTYSPHETALGESLSYLRYTLGQLSRGDLAALTSIYLGELLARGVAVYEDSFLPSERSTQLVAYVKNNFSDEACDVLSQDMRSPRVSYMKSFGECAAALDKGEVGFCLLPLEERGGVRLPTVAELIYRYDFKINAVTPVFGFDGNADLKYALVSKHFTVPKRKAGDDRYLELRISASSGASLPELLMAFEYFGLAVYRINTVTLGIDGDGGTHYSLVLRDGGEGFVGALLYLALFAHDTVPVGVYKNLE